MEPKFMASTSNGQQVQVQKVQLVQSNAGQQVTFVQVTPLFPNFLCFF